MNIAELFYPKELKEIIADLRAKGELDEIVLKKMNKFIRRQFIIAVITSLLMILACFVFMDIFATLFFMILAIYVFLSIIKDVLHHLKIYPILYSLDSTTEGIVTNAFVTGIGYFGVPYGWGMNYDYYISGQKYSGWVKEIKNYFRRDKYQVGQSVVIFYHPEKPDQSIPYITSLYPLFNLKRKT